MRSEHKHRPDFGMNALVIKLIQRRMSLWFGHGARGKRRHSEHEEYSVLSMDDRGSLSWPAKVAKNLQRGISEKK